VPEVDDEAEVGLVVTHAKGGRGDQHLELVGEQAAFRLEPCLVVERAPVSNCGDALAAQELGDVLDVAHREAVDDP
jgi:hypothetical protein